MITQLDVLVEGGRGDEEYRDLMFQTLVSLNIYFHLYSYIYNCTFQRYDIFSCVSFGFM